MADHLWTLPAVVKFWAERQPEATPFVFCTRHGPGVSLNSRDLYTMAGRFASQLRQSGFQYGDVIANSLPNSPERVVTDVGVIMAGCIALNCQILEKDGGDFWNTLHVSKCKGVIFPEKQDNATFKLLWPYCESELPGLPGWKTAAVPKAPTLQKVIVVQRSQEDIAATNNPLFDDVDGSAYSKPSVIFPEEDTGTCVADNDMQCLEDMVFLGNLLSRNEDILVVDCSPSDCAYIFSTSGSTGYRKLVPRSHENLLRMARKFDGEKAVKLFNDRLVGWLGGFPFDYYGTCSSRLLQDAYEGHNAIRPEDLWAVLEREQCQGAVFSPVVIGELLHVFKARPPEFKLKFIIATGEPVKKNTMQGIGILADVMITMYASTETGVLSMMTVKDPVQYRDFTCGRPVTGVKIRVVDENLQDVPPETEGSVIVQGGNIFQGYYNYNPPESLFTSDGWFITKDRGLMDDKGILYVSCREGEVVTQGNILVYLNWPESLLGRCPGVADVSVIGLKDSEGGDRICACVMPAAGSGLTKDSLLAFYNDLFVVTSDSTREFRLKPEINYVMFYDSLPVNASGKIDRKQMQENARKVFSLR